MAVEGLPVQYDSLGNNIFENGTNALAYIQNNANKQTSKMVNDSGDLSQYKLEDILNSTLDDSTKNYLVEYYLGEKSNQNAWNRQMDASNTQYQRAVQDLQKAGFNPFLAFQSLGGSSVPSSSGNSSSGGLYLSEKNAKRDYQGNLMKVIALIAAAASRILK